MSRMFVSEGNGSIVSAKVDGSVRPNSGETLKHIESSGQELDSRHITTKHIEQKSDRTTTDSERNTTERSLYANTSVHKIAGENTTEVIDLIIKQNRKRIIEVWKLGNCLDRIDVSSYDATSKRVEGVMFASGPGRLGNKMFQYASLIGIARQNGYAPLSRDTIYISRVFKVSHVVSEPIPNSSIWLMDKLSSTYDSCMEHVSKNHGLPSLWILPVLEVFQKRRT